MLLSSVRFRSVCALLGGFAIGSCLFPTWRFIAQSVRSGVVPWSKSGSPPSMTAPPASGMPLSVGALALLAIGRAVRHKRAVVRVKVKAFRGQNTSGDWSLPAQAFEEIVSMAALLQNAVSIATTAAQGISMAAVDIHDQTRTFAQLQATKQKLAAIEERVLNIINAVERDAQAIHPGLKAEVARLKSEKHRFEIMSQLEDVVVASLVLPARFQEAVSLATTAAQSMCTAVVNLPDRARALEQIQSTKQELAAIEGRVLNIADAVQRGAQAVDPNLNAEIARLKSERKRLELKSEFEKVVIGVGELPQNFVAHFGPRVQGLQNAATEALELPGRAVGHVAKSIDVAKSAAQGFLEVPVQIVASIDQSAQSAVSHLNELQGFVQQTIGDLANTATSIVELPGDDMSGLVSSVEAMAGADKEMAVAMTAVPGQMQSFAASGDGKLENNENHVVEAIRGCVDGQCRVPGGFGGAQNGRLTAAQQTHGEFENNQNHMVKAIRGCADGQCRVPGGFGGAQDGRPTAAQQTHGEFDCVDGQCRIPRGFGGAHDGPPTAAQQTHGRLTAEQLKPFTAGTSMPPQDRTAAPVHDDFMHDMAPKVAKSS